MLHSAAGENVAPFYPTSRDQVQYLAESYTGYALLVKDGPLTGTLENLQQPRAQGMLMQLEAAFLFLQTGPTRLAALDLNIAFLLMYLGVTALLIRRSLGLAPALASVGLIVGARAITAPIGGIFDFRLDFQAMCLWGVLVAFVGLAPEVRAHAVVRTLGLGAVAAWLCLTRIIATAYVFVFLSVLILASFFIARGLPYMGRRLAVALVASSTAAAWFAVQHWALVEGYYIGGHVVGDEKRIRALEVGVTTLLSSAAFYPVSVLRDQAGLVFVASATLLVFITGAGVLQRGPRDLANRLRASTSGQRWTVAALALAFLIPYAIMTSDEAKSSVVASILLPPLVLGVAWTVAAPSRLGAPAAFQRAALVASCVVLMLGLGAQWRNLQNTIYLPQPRGDMAAASQFITRIGEHVQQTGSGSAVWAADAHLDFTPGLVAQVYYYEQHHVWLNLATVLGDGPIATPLSRDEILKQAASSNVLLLSVGGQPTYPYDLSIQQVKPELFDLARQRYALLDQFRIEGTDVFAFVRDGP